MKNFDQYYNLTSISQKILTTDLTTNDVVKVYSHVVVSRVCGLHMEEPEHMKPFVDDDGDPKTTCSRIRTS